MAPFFIDAQNFEYFNNIEVKPREHAKYTTKLYKSIHARVGLQHSIIRKLHFSFIHIMRHSSS